jgi:Homeodomain-like domain
MPVALSLTLRQLIVSEKKKGKTLVQISDHYHLSYTTVCRVYGRFKAQGKQGLLTCYGNCGARQPCWQQALMRRAAVWLKRLHPLWGAALIRVLLQQRYNQRIASERTLQRWFLQAGVKVGKTHLPLQREAPVKRVHDLWQMDAKEKLHLCDGTRICYLTVVDKKSGSLLDCFVFPPLSYQ